MKTYHKTIKELIKTKDSPIPLEIIPNHMGINLCSVDSITWQRQSDGQLVNLTINFIPASNVYTVRYADPMRGNKGECVYITLYADSEEQAKDMAMENMEFVKHIYMKGYDRKYLTAFEPSEYKFSELRKVIYYEGDERL